MHSIITKDYYEAELRILVAVDCIIFGFSQGTLKLLLFKRQVEPFKDEWSIIGSFVNPQEDVQQAASQVLKSYTGLEDVFLEELGCYGSPSRDPGGRVISIAHFALIRGEELKNETSKQYTAQWFDYDQLPDLILDHRQMIENALEALRHKLRYRPVGFELLPEKFTLPQLKTLYDAIYQTNVDRRNFRKKIISMKILKKLDEKDKTSSRKGAFLYCFDLKKYQALTAKGFNFEL